MNSFIWLDDYNIGDNTIDKQHEYLFELANRIINPNEADSLLQNVMLLFRYVREHFTAEEALMKRLNYSGYEEHVKEHNLLITILTDISKNIKAGETGSREIMGFMRFWLLEHILEVDMQFGQFLGQEKNQNL